MKYQNSKKREIFHFSKKEGYSKIGPENEKQVQSLGREYCKCSQMWNCFIPLTKVVVEQLKFWDEHGNNERRERCIWNR